MPDMLVKLYELEDLAPLISGQLKSGITIRRAIAPEKRFVVGWARTTFNENWGDECDVCFSNHPISCFIAVKEGKIIGFSCYDTTCRNFLGPIGMTKETRGLGTGKALLLACCHAVATMGYAYAIIGDVSGPEEFYRKSVGAVSIEGSTPGIYRGLLKK